MTSVVDYARDLLENHTDLPRALKERALIASLPAIPRSRTHRAPNFASDLGVRKNDDASSYLLGWQRRTETPPPDSTKKPSEISISNWESGVLCDNTLTAHLDALISFAGDWEEAAAIGQWVHSSRRAPKTYRLNTYLGAALSAAGEEKAEKLFIAAVVVSASDPVDEALARIRLAAWYVKRRQDLVAGATTLTSLRKHAQRHAAEHRIAPGDLNALTGVAANLEALIAAKQKRHEDAYELLSSGRAMLGDTDNVMVGEDERRRYFAQVTVNLAQLDARSGNLKQAQQRASHHLEWAEAHEPGSLSEALAIASYTSFLNQEYEEASAHGYRCIHEILDEGSPSRLTAARKVLAAALHSAGKTDDAAQVIVDIDEDPDGLRHFFEGNASPYAPE